MRCFQIGETGVSPFDEPVRTLRSADPSVVALNASVTLEEDGNGAGRFIVPVLSGEVIVRYPEIRIEASGGMGSFTVKLLTVIYLSRADGVAPAGKWIAYRELPGARFYEPVLVRSVEEPLAAAFGADPEAFRIASMSLGGREEGFADSSFSFALFPLVRLCFLLWDADAEFTARCGVLFDSSCGHHLSAFDLRMGAQEVSSRLLRFAGERGSRSQS